MDQARYIVAVLMIVALPPSIGSWFLIHPFVRFWRRLGIVAAYSVIYSLLISACLLLWNFRALLVGADLGFEPLLLALALPAAVGGPSSRAAGAGY